MTPTTALLLIAGASVQHVLATDFADGRTTMSNPHETKLVESGIPPTFTKAGIEEEHMYKSKLYLEYLSEGVPKGLIKHCSVPGSMALTFDDGPWIYTSDILDTLET
ncbi:hypothetical protein V8F20_008253 [Naviculisporaceae sp. PSN 640]